MLDRYDENLILGYIEDELDAQEMVRFEQMIAEDESARQLIEQLKLDRACLKAVPAVEAPGELMTSVHASLEREMLIGSAGSPAATGTVTPNGEHDAPATYRFPRPSRSYRWARFGGAIAAALALAAGATWYFDLFGWNKPVNPIEVAIHTPGPEKNGGQMRDGNSAPTPVPAPPIDGGHNSAIASKRNTTDQVEHSRTTDPVAGAQGAAPTPTGKGTAALAMAQAQTGELRKSADAKDTAVEHLKWKTGSAFKDTAGSFQIELATASAASTKQLLVAWADANGADFDGEPMAGIGASIDADARSNKLRENLDKARVETRDENKSLGQGGAPADGAAAGKAPPPAPTSPAPGAPAPPAAPAADIGLEKAQPGPPAPSIAKGDAPAPARGTPAKPGAAAKGDVPANAAKTDRSTEEQAEAEHVEAAPRLSESDRDGARGADRLARAVPLEKAKQARAVRQEVTLLVPADRVDGLVQHLESKTGQSLIVVREGEETLLLSPQVANRRALKKAAEARKDVGDVPGAASFGNAGPDRARADGKDTLGGGTGRAMVGGDVKSAEPNGPKKYAPATTTVPTAPATPSTASRDSEPQPAPTESAAQTDKALADPAKPAPARTAKTGDAATPAPTSPAVKAESSVDKPDVADPRTTAPAPGNVAPGTAPATTAATPAAPGAAGSAKAGEKVEKRGDEAAKETAQRKPHVKVKIVIVEEAE